MRERGGREGGREGGRRSWREREKRERKGKVSEADIWGENRDRGNEDYR